jgi:hypothetical protein
MLARDSFKPHFGIKLRRFAQYVLGVEQVTVGVEQDSVIFRS